MDLDSAEIVQYVCIIYLLSIFMENTFFSWKCMADTEIWIFQDNQYCENLFCFLVLGFRIQNLY